MEPINFEDAPFTWKNILPRVGEPVTTLWGRKFAKNVVNAHGLIGSIQLAGEPGFVNLSLSHKFLFPPFVQSFWKESTGTSWHTSHQFREGFIANSTLGKSNEGVVTLVSLEGVLFIPKPVHHGTTLDVIYKIHGV